MTVERATELHTQAADAFERAYAACLGVPYEQNPDVHHAMHRALDLADRRRDQLERVLLASEARP